MNNKLKELVAQATHDVLGVKQLDSIILAELILAECAAACDEVAEEADAMVNSKFVTDAGRMLHEGMWGGAQNCKASILNRLGIE